MEKLAKAGIEMIGDIPWGIHFCQFYQTKEDLLDILIPYFRAGLENNEFCMWITSEPLDEQKVLSAMKKALPNFDQYLKKGQIEILPYTEWYLKGGEFDSKRTLDGWVDKLNQALAKGYEGLRLTGNTFWLEKKDWKRFTEYENEVDNMIGRHRMIAVCTYSLNKCRANEVIDVISNHQFALIRREGKWEIIETSERRRAKEALQKERDKAQTYLEIAGVILVVIDSDQRVSLINKKGCVVLGYKEEEIIGKNWFDHFFREAERNKVKTVFSKLITGDIQEAEYSENLILTKSGEERMIAWHNTLLRDEMGNVIATLSSGEDITEHKRADDALKWESELNLAKAELLNAILATESLEDISSRALEHARHLTRSEYGFAGYIDPETGYAITPTLTKDIWDICEVQDKDIVFKKFTGLWGWVLKNQKPLLTNSPSQDPRSSGIPHGHVPIHRFLSAPALFEGKLVGQLALANSDRDYSRRDLELVEGLAAIFAIAIYHKRVDEALQKAKNELEKRVQERTAELSKTNELLAAEIAERRRTEIALKESETKYRIVADNTYDWEWWRDPEGNFIYVSPSCKRITHHEPEEFTRDPDLLLRNLHPDDKPSFIRHQSEIEQKISSGEIEFRIFRPDGSFRWLAHACQPVFDKDGRFLGRRGSNRDITERKQSEESLRKSEEQLRYLSSQLLSAEEKERKRISREIHDGIGQYLTAIKFRVENILQQMDRRKAKQIAEPLETIIPLIQQSIEESRRIQMDLRPSILDDLGILATLSWFCREFQTTYSGISIGRLIDINEDEVPDSLKTVIYRISQEALNNVAKHSKADLVHLALRKSDGKIELAIQDNGDGFDLKEVLPREGSERGLGLTSMRERTELSGGSFEIESTIGTGTKIKASWAI